MTTTETRGASGAGSQRTGARTSAARSARVGGATARRTPAQASALGIPVIADPEVYPEIEHGVTGFHAATPGELRECLELLAGDPDLRRRVGAAAKAHVTEHRNVQVASQHWVEVLQSAVPASAAA